MRNDASFSPVDTDFDVEAETRALVAQTARLLVVTRALVSSRRPVDVVELRDHIGLLCAKALDLPLGQTGFIKVELARLVTLVDELTDGLRANAI